jgi:hypothetical protein
MPVFGRNYVCLEIVGNSVIFPDDIVARLMLFYESSTRRSWCDGDSIVFLTGEALLRTYETSRDPATGNGSIGQGNSLPPAKLLGLKRGSFGEKKS